MDLARFSTETDTLMETMVKSKKKFRNFPLIELFAALFVDIIHTDSSDFGAPEATGDAGLTFFLSKNTFFEL